MTQTIRDKRYKINLRIKELEKLASEALTIVEQSGDASAVYILICKRINELEDERDKIKYVSL